MAKKVLSLILVLIMLSLALMACGGRDDVSGGNNGGSNNNNDDAYADDDNQDNADDNGTQNGGTTDDSDDEDDDGDDEDTNTTLGDGFVDKNILKKLPQADYDGAEYRISLPNAEHAYQFDPSRITGNLENDAIYRWKKKVQDTFNVKIVHTNWGTTGNGSDYYEAASPEIKNGLSKFNIYGHYAYMISQFIMNGCFQDWNALGNMKDSNGQKYLDLSAIRWDQKLNSEVTYNGKLLSLTGDLGVSKLQSAMATFVNFDLLERYCDMDSEELYGFVEDGSWTFEKFKEVVAKIYKNDNIAGLNSGDTLGYYAVSGNQGDIWFPAFNQEITARDEVNNTITATFMSDEKNEKIIKELRSFFHDSNNVMYAFSTGDQGSESKFIKEELGFVTSQFRSVYGETGFNNMNNFGIVPTPKYDVAQDAYRTKLNDRYTIWGLPTSLKNDARAFTAHITDALCAESSETLYFEYYETLLKNRYSQDPQTAKMVDVVMSNPHFDTSIQFGTHIGDYTYLPRNLIVNRDLPIESTYQAAAGLLNDTLQRIYDCYK